MELSSIDETRLVADATAGDTRAYGELVRRHQQVAFRVAYTITRDAGDAEDAAQEAFLKAYQALSRFRREAPFRPWVLRIVANEARNRNRRRGRQRRLAIRAWDGPDHDAEPEALRRVEDAHLRTAVDSLERRQRDVIVCRYLLELSEAETAAVLGVPPGTVKSRLARGLRRLSAMLGEGDA